MLGLGYKVKIVHNSGQVQEEIGLWSKDFLQSLTTMELPTCIEIILEHETIIHHEVNTNSGWCVVSLPQTDLRDTEPRESMHGYVNIIVALGFKTEGSLR